MGCKQCVTNPSLFYMKDRNNQLIGVLGLHVDDFIYGGMDEFQDKVIKNLHQIFRMGKTEKNVFRYVGYQVKQDADFSILVYQNDYAQEKVKLIKITPERAKQVEEKLTAEEETDIRKGAGRIGWLGQRTRPDVAFAQVEMSTKFGQAGQGSQQGG